MGWVSFGGKVPSPWKEFEFHENCDIYENQILTI